ncbi:MAG: flagellar export chaperone FliS [Firmicutes bacterium]|nr:flagellar export chaperone FliS [Bacillota bacterium]
MAVNPQQKYLEVQIQTAPPEKLVTMLYSGAIKFMTQAKKNIENGELEKAHNNLVRAQDIFYELISGLNMEAGEIAENLYKLYDFMIATLIEVNINKDPTKLVDIITMVSELKEAWVEATSKVTGTGSANGDRFDLAKAGK